MANRSQQDARVNAWHSKAFLCPPVSLHSYKHMCICAPSRWFADLILFEDAVLKLEYLEVYLLKELTPRLSFWGSLFVLRPACLRPNLSRLGLDHQLAPAIVTWWPPLPGAISRFQLPLPMYMCWGISLRHGFLDICRAENVREGIPPGAVFHTGLNELWFKHQLPRPMSEVTEAGSTWTFRDTLPD